MRGGHEAEGKGEEYIYIYIQLGNKRREEGIELENVKEREADAEEPSTPNRRENVLRGIFVCNITLLGLIFNIAMSSS